MGEVRNQDNNRSRQYQGESLHMKYGCVHVQCLSILTCRRLPVSYQWEGLLGKRNGVSRVC